MGAFIFLYYFQLVYKIIGFTISFLYLMACLCLHTQCDLLLINTGQRLQVLRKKTQVWEGLLSFTMHILRSWENEANQRSTNTVRRKNAELKRPPALPRETTLDGAHARQIFFNHIVRNQVCNMCILLYALPINPAVFPKYNCVRPGGVGGSNVITETYSFKVK